MPLIRKLAMALPVLLATITPAAAQSCNFTVSNMAFGNVDVIAGGAINTTSTLDIDCTGIPLTTVRICPNIQAGTGGADAVARYMSGPGAPKLAYQIYQDAARTTVWGSSYWGLPGDPPTVNLPLGLSGSASTSLTIYGRVFAGQNSVPAGPYSSSFTGTETIFDYGLDVLGLVDCGDLPILDQTSNPTFLVTATVLENCLLGTQDINFGTQGVLNANVDANGEISLTCTPDTSYVIELDNGLTGAGPTTRLMTKGAETITYGLYKDSSLSLAWGDSSTPGSEVSGSGNGTQQILTVYGRVPAQTTPSPGTYTDTIVVTLTY